MSFSYRRKLPDFRPHRHFKFRTTPWEQPFRSKLQAWWHWEDMVLAADPNWIKEWPARIGGPGFKIYYPSSPYYIGSRYTYNSLLKPINYIKFGYTPQTDSYFTFTENSSFTIVFILPIELSINIPGIRLYSGQEISVYGRSNTARHIVASVSTSFPILYFTDGSSLTSDMHNYYCYMRAPAARLTNITNQPLGNNSVPSMAALTVHQGWITYWGFPGSGNYYRNTYILLMLDFLQGKRCELWVLMVWVGIRITYQRY